MIDSKHVKGQQDIVDAINNYFSSIIYKISKNIVDNKINDEILSTFQWGIIQNKIMFTPPHLWFLKLSKPKKLNL